jgi:hypothetical protein
MKHSFFSVSDYKVLQKVVQLSGYTPESVARPEKIRDKETEEYSWRKFMSIYTVNIVWAAYVEYPTATI